MSSHKLARPPLLLPKSFQMPFPRASQALTRFTVLDLTRVRSGPTCVRQLADWGANVIKIETPPHLEKGEGRAARAKAGTSRTCIATSAA